MRILVAEDETIIRLDLVKMLGRAGLEVCAEARDGEEAVALAREFEPDLAIHQAKDIVALVRTQTFRDVTLSKSVRGWVAARCAATAPRAWGVGAICCCRPPAVARRSLGLG